MPEISLHIAVYNRSSYLAKAVESVLAQSYTDWELLIADDGSTDNSRKIALSYEARSSRIKTVAFPHRGVSPTMRDAVALTNGELIGWVDSDDWLHPDALRETITALQNNPQCGAAYTDFQAVDESGDSNLYLSCSARIPYSKDMMLQHFMTHHFRLIRRSCYSKAGGIDTEFKFNYDWDLCLRLSGVTDFIHLPKILYYRRIHDDSISKKHRQEQMQYAYKVVSQATKRRMVNR
jgi:glycosyltransferase involved in cell wall biosynthesis